MSLETAQFIHQLNPANPAGSDRLQQGDDHLRLLKSALQATFPNLKGAMTLSDTFLNNLGSHLVPVGSITLFSGAEAPEGWGICNGSTYLRVDGSASIVSPDLRNRVPVGVSEDRLLGTTFGQTSRTLTSEVGGGHTHTATAAAGGSHTHLGRAKGHKLTVAEMPSHSHGNGIADDATNLFPRGSKALASATSYAVSSERNTGSNEGITEAVGEGLAHTHDVEIDSDGSHAHDITVASASGHAHQFTVDVTQPSIALHYIIKL